MDIKRIVNCTPEQFEALHRDGQVEVDGVVRTREEGTLYNPGELQLLEWYNKVMAEELGRHTIAHTPMTTKTLEQEYEDILASNTNYVNTSAVGYRAILQNGDTVKVTGNSGDFFLNGERLTKDYTYNGDGCEMVSVWVFEGLGAYGGNMIQPPKLTDTPTFAVYEIYIKYIGQTPEVAQNYYLYADKITAYSFDLPVQPKGCRVLIANGTYDFTQKAPVVAQEVYSDCEKYTSSAFANNLHIKKLSLPKCKELLCPSNASLFNSNNITEWEFGKLHKVSGGSTYVFLNVKNVVIPDTVQIIGSKTCQSATTLRLECNNATDIKPDWYTHNPPTSFTMAKDWRASINIAIAAKSWTPDRMVDLFTNYLADMKSNDPNIINLAELTIPQEIFSQLTVEELAIAKNKGWSIGGA